MLPTLLPGDSIQIQNASLDDVVPGDIVLYRRDQSLFVHRLMAVDSTASRFVARGDSMTTPDPQGGSVLLGRVVAIERKGRTIKSSRHLRASSRLAGLLLCHSNLLRNLFLLWHLGGRFGLVTSRNAAISK
jgi:hypothetical protein